MSKHYENQFQLALFSKKAKKLSEWANACLPAFNR